MKDEHKEVEKMVLRVEDQQITQQVIHKPNRIQNNPENLINPKSKMLNVKC